MITMQLRFAVLFFAAACGTASASREQQATQKQNVPALLEKLHSSDGSERAKAFVQLHSDSANLKSPEVRSALLDLLDRENHEFDSQLLEAQEKGHPDEGDNDNAGFVEYFGDLVGAVDSFADWNDPRQACILVDANSSDESAFTEEIADHARVTVPCLMKRSASVISMNRAASVPVLVQALAKAKDTLDPGTVQSASRIVLGALQDPDELVRALTIHALAGFGAEDTIPALRKVAEADPEPEVDGHSIRKLAADAIAAIEKRTTGQGEPQLRPQR